MKNYSITGKGKVNAKETRNVKTLFSSAKGLNYVAIT